MRENQRKLNELREKLDGVRRSIVKTEMEVNDDRAAVAAEVARSGDVPASWFGESVERERRLEALRLGAEGIEVEIHHFLNATKLAVARVANGRETPAVRKLDALRSRRSTLMAEAARATEDGEATPETFPAALSEVENQIRTAEAEVEAIRSEIMELSAA